MGGDWEKIQEKNRKKSVFPLNLRKFFDNVKNFFSHLRFFGILQMECMTIRQFFGLLVRQNPVLSSKNRNNCFSMSMAFLRRCAHIYN